MTNHFIIDTFDWSRSILANCWRYHSYIQILFRALEAQSEEEPSADAEALTMYIVSVWPLLTVTTRTIPFLRWVFYKPLFAIVTGGGATYIFLYIHAPSTIHILNLGSAKSLKGSRKQTMMNIDGIDWNVGELNGIETKRGTIETGGGLQPVAASRCVTCQESPVSGATEEAGEAQANKTDIRWQLVTGYSWYMLIQW